MKSSNIFSAFAGLITMHHALSIAADAPCDPITKYTTEWFLANTKPEWRTNSFDSTALFYSSGLSDRAKEFARKSQKHTIWEVWPCENYWIKDTRSNPLQCIMRSPKEEKTYFENMSRAFAMKARHVATVMHEDIYNPPMDRIWGTVEWPALTASGNLNYVNLIPSALLICLTDRSVTITAIKAYNTAEWDIAWAREKLDRLVDGTKKQIYQTLQSIIYPRDIDGTEADIEKRGSFDACPIEIQRIDKDHPLY